MTPWLSTSPHGDDAAIVFRPEDAATSGQSGAAPARARLAMAKWLFALKDGRPFPEFRASAGEPGWDMLLDLYVSELLGRKTSVTSACIGSRAPPTTALRYVNALCDAKRIERRRDENDARRCWLQLTADVREEIDRYLMDMIDDFLDILKARV